MTGSFNALDKPVDYSSDLNRRRSELMKGNPVNIGNLIVFGGIALLNARQKLRLARLLWFLVVLMSVASAPYAWSEVVYGLEPQLGMKLVYPGLKNHKAFAIGPGGIWTHVEGQSSAQAAQKAVLRNCNSYVTSVGRAKFGKCELVAVDDKMVWSKPIPSPALDEVLPLPDRPLSKAQLFQPAGGKIKGVVLMLHGSENHYSVNTNPKSTFYQSWIQYFNSAGMLVVYPSSFHDVIPASEYSGWNDAESYPRANAMQLLRVAQTNRTLRELHKQYASKPIYIWSHSAGGNVAQSISEPISGAIIVGTTCGVGSPVLNTIPKNVPVLYVYGEHDEYLVRGKKRITLKTMLNVCGRGYGKETRKIKIAENEGHSTSIWHDNVMDAVADLLGQPHFDIGSRGETFPLPAEASGQFEKQYRYLPLKKAFAVGKKGVGYSGSQVSQREADLMALFLCNKADTGFAYPPSGRHACRIYARGEKVVKSK